MTLWAGIAIVIATLVVGSVLYAIVARHSPAGGRESKTPTGVYAVTAGAMSLLIAFTLSLTFSQYLDAQQSAATEAEAVISMSRAASLMPAKVRDPLRNELVCYADEVINLSWPAVRDGDTQVQPAIRTTLARMDTIVADNINIIQDRADLWEGANQQRLAAHMQMLQIAGNGVPPILWLLLIVGSLITIGSLVVYADRGKPAWGHVIVILGPLFVASAALVVIAFFDRPYADTPGAVTPRAMVLARERLQTDQIGTMPMPYCPK